MKVLGTTIFLYGDELETARQIGKCTRRQFRIICGCKSRADANRQAEAANLESNTFRPAYTSETGNEEELKIAGNGGLFIEINRQYYPYPLKSQESTPTA